LFQPTSRFVIIHQISFFFGSSAPNFIEEKGEENAVLILERERGTGDFGCREIK